MFSPRGISSFLTPEISLLNYGWELAGEVWSCGGTSVWIEESSGSEQCESCAGSAAQRGVPRTYREF